MIRPWTPKLDNKIRQKSYEQKTESPFTSCEVIEGKANIYNKIRQKGIEQEIDRQMYLPDAHKIYSIKRDG